MDERNNFATIFIANAGDEDANLSFIMMQNARKLVVATLALFIALFAFVY